MSSPPPHHHTVRPPSPVIPVARHGEPGSFSETLARQDVDRAINPHILLPPLQMASASGCIPDVAKTGPKKKKKKKKKKKESDSESEYEPATKHIATAPVRFSKRVSRSASHRIPAALFAHPRRTVRTVQKRVHFNTCVLVVAHSFPRPITSRPRKRLRTHLPCHLTDFLRSGLPNVLPGETTIKKEHRRSQEVLNRRSQRAYWCGTGSCWQTRWPSSSRKIHQRGAK